VDRAPALNFAEISQDAEDDSRSRVRAYGVGDSAHLSDGLPLFTAPSLQYAEREPARTACRLSAPGAPLAGRLRRFDSSRRMRPFRRPGRLGYPCETALGPCWSVPASGNISDPSDRRSLRPATGSGLLGRRFYQPLSGAWAVTMVASSVVWPAVRAASLRLPSTSRRFSSSAVRSFSVWATSCLSTSIICRA
jgi:hypothetical protein